MKNTRNAKTQELNLKNADLAWGTRQHEAAMAAVRKGHECKNPGGRCCNNWTDEQLRSYQNRIYSGGWSR